MKACLSSSDTYETFPVFTYKTFPVFVVLCCALGRLDVQWRIVKGYKRFRVAVIGGSQLFMKHLRHKGQSAWSPETCVRYVNDIQTWVESE